MIWVTFWFDPSFPRHLTSLEWGAFHAARVRNVSKVKSPPQQFDIGQRLASVVIPVTHDIPAQRSKRQNPGHGMQDEPPLHRWMEGPERNGEAGEQLEEQDRCRRAR